MHCVISSPRKRVLVHTSGAEFWKWTQSWTKEGSRNTGSCFCRWVAVLQCDLYSFPVAGVINDHKFDGLRKKCILSEFWRLEVGNEGVSWVQFAPEDLRENPSLFFPASCGSSLSLKATEFNQSLHFHRAFSSVSK